MSCDCLTDAIAGASISVLLRRPPSGYYDEKGRWKERERFPDVEFMASVQPLRPNELVDLPENRRTRAAIKLYTETLLKTVSVDEKVQPDIVIPQSGQFKNVEFQVDSVIDWSDLGGYYKALATKLGQ
jgi:hypothetical protein